MQNKPNFLKAKNNATNCAANTYEKKPPQPNSKKQTQSNPIPSSPPTIPQSHPALFTCSTCRFPLPALYTCRESSTNRPLFSQNKANFKIGKMTISTVATRPYPNEQRTISNGRLSKQTQSNPISNAETVQWCEKSHPTGLSGGEMMRAFHSRAGSPCREIWPRPQVPSTVRLSSPQATSGQRRG